VRGQQPILCFNRGIISRLAMARVDLKRYAMAAEEQTNFIPRVLGSAMLRPGLEYITTTRDNQRARYLDFIFSIDDTAIIELTPLVMRVLVDETPVTRPSVSSVITNGNFNASLVSWTDIDETLGTSQWVTGGYMGLQGLNGDYGGRRQQVTVAPADVGVVHAVRVVIERGEIDILVGSSAGGEQYFRVTLGRGTHSLAFTPNADFWVDLIAFTEYESLVDSCTIEAAGIMELPTPWSGGSLADIRKDQSGDIIYVACDGHQQMKIERRGTTSWSIVYYEPETGPFRAINTSRTTISNSAIRGATTLTASQRIFNNDLVGALFQLESNGQDVDDIFAVDEQVGDKIVVTGVGDARDVEISLLFGGAVATITLQRSVGDTEVWEDTATSYTANTTTTFNDTLDNQIVAYRLKCTAYTSGSVDGQLRYEYGSIVGVVRIISITNAKVAEAIVLQRLGNIGTLGNSATLNWREGTWSDSRGWPSAVALAEGRLWWAGKDKWFGSVTDDFANWDPDYEGDAGPIQRSIGSGPVSTICWLLPLQRLLAGTDATVVAGRSSSFEELLTPSNFNTKIAITQGTERSQAARIDETGVFIQRGGYRVLAISSAQDINATYSVEDLSQLVPDLGAPGIELVVVQRQPDTRVHAMRSDGKVAVMVYDKNEDVKCWILVETDGRVEDMLVMPGADGEDNVYYLVRRTIEGVSQWYFEKWAREDECIGGDECKLADSFVVYDGSNLTHLEGEDVVGWFEGVAYDAVEVVGGVADGMPVGAIVGLAYDATYKSTKLAYLAQPGENALASRKRANSLALVLADVHARGIKYSAVSFADADMDDLPAIEANAEVDEDTVHEEYNYEAFSLPGEWGVDTRLYLKASAPRPCTLLGAIVGLNANSTQ
jgi:hypothetical protein